MNRMYRRKWHKLRKQEGKCWRCPKPSRPGKGTCLDCAIAQSEAYYSKKLEKAA